MKTSLNIDDGQHSCLLLKRYTSSDDGVSAASLNANKIKTLFCERGAHTGLSKSTIKNTDPVSF